ncbi:uncharacterized protein OCT59_020004 [Rhizophagus irregularis]|uniref:uncharacterized protein n=1 Tax=Rhizophagus irregularis TaxID=588596 RepID=UPI00332BE995|nr:hypothetical protein OCT59_020004 [Rhizophagus irregularis]
MIDKFLIEAKICHENIHGISQNPDTKDYIIVLQDIYCEKCGEKYTNERIKWILSEFRYVCLTLIK